MFTLHQVLLTFAELVPSIPFLITVLVVYYAHHRTYLQADKFGCDNDKRHIGKSLATYIGVSIFLYLFIAILDFTHGGQVIKFVSHPAAMLVFFGMSISMSLVMLSYKPTTSASN